MFLTLMVVGLAGLVAMALPALGRHGAAGHVGKLASARGALVSAKSVALVHPSPSLTRFLPSPRLVFSLLALYGAFGGVFAAAHLALGWAALAAIVPTAIVERFAVTPLWRLLFRYQGLPSSPLAEVVMSEATAVSAFRRGRGIVSVVRDGRLVQFSARLVDAQVGVVVQVGDRLRVEDVEPERERLTVSILKP
ncbi:MAG TPA: hypothetical protein VLX92_23855 [Kofleriaceae bacterium]|nr:hypothetical protein [Kofleriaceae bacterium]